MDKEKVIECAFKIYEQLRDEFDYKNHEDVCVSGFNSLVCAMTLFLADTCHPELHQKIINRIPISINDNLKNIVESINSVTKQKNHESIQKKTSIRE